MSVEVASDGLEDATLIHLRGSPADVIYIVVVREPSGALRVEDTTPGWSDMPDEELMYLGRS